MANFDVSIFVKIRATNVSDKLVTSQNEEGRELIEVHVSLKQYRPANFWWELISNGFALAGWLISSLPSL